MIFDGFGDKPDKCARRPADLNLLPPSAEITKPPTIAKNSQLPAWRRRRRRGMVNADYGDRQPGHGVGAEIGEE